MEYDQSTFRQTHIDLLFGDHKRPPWRVDDELNKVTICFLVVKQKPETFGFSHLERKTQLCFLKHEPAFWNSQRFPALFKTTFGFSFSLPSFGQKRPALVTRILPRWVDWDLLAWWWSQPWFLPSLLHSNVLASHIDIFLGVLQVIVYIYYIFNIYIYIYNMLYKILNILYI